MDEAWLRDALHRYDQIVERAQAVAQIVHRVRFPRDHPTYFDINFDEDRLNDKRVFASYYYRSNDHRLDFPVHYLSASDDEVQELEAERIAAEHAAAEQRRLLQEAAEEAERAQIERKTYERLKAKFEGEGDGRQPHKRSSANRSPDPA